MFALIGLGSNMGDRAAILDEAVAALAGESGIVVRSASRHHETAPVGGPEGQGAFLNAAAVLETSLSPAGLHAVLMKTEREAGRVRSVRWGARTLDIDLLLHGDARVDTPELKVPHPRMAVRRFVLAPAAEVAPDARDPSTGLTIAELLANIDRRPSHLRLVGPPGPGRDGVFRRLLAELAAVDLTSIGEVEGLEKDRWTASQGGPGDPSSLVPAAPTFAASWNPKRDREPGPPPFSESLKERFPTLRIESTDLDEVVSEIVTACKATRPG